MMSAVEDTDVQESSCVSGESANGACFLEGDLAMLNKVKYIVLCDQLVMFLRNYPELLIQVHKGPYVRP